MASAARRNFSRGSQGNVHGHQPAFPLRVEGGPEGERLDPGDGQAELVADAGAVDLLDSPFRDGPAVALSRQLRQAPFVRQAQVVSDHPFTQGKPLVRHAPGNEASPHRLPGVAEDPQDQQDLLFDVGGHHANPTGRSINRQWLADGAYHQ